MTSAVVLMEYLGSCVFIPLYGETWCCSVAVHERLVVHVHELAWQCCECCFLITCRSFYHNRVLKSEYGVDTEEIRNYFPLDHVVLNCFSLGYTMEYNISYLHLHMYT